MPHFFCFFSFGAVAAFDTAETLGIPKLLDAEDMLVGDTPEQFSVMTYLSQMYRAFEYHVSHFA